MIAHPIHRKRKSVELCQAFLEGAGEAGRATDAAVFYGVEACNEAHFRRCQAQARDWYYIDNSYFDAVRGQQFRITKNRLQHSGRGSSDGTRFRAMGIELQAMQEDGRHIVVCPQSPHFMHLARYPGDWLADTRASLRESCPGREVVVREWSPDKAALARTLAEDLKGAWALVTWSSAAAVTALIAGVPVFSQSPDSAAWELSGCGLMLDPERAFPSIGERVQWASVLADNQWSLDEIRDGTAWRSLNG